MYAKIAVPVDLAHTEQLDKALATAADLARLYDAEVFIVSVTTPVPGETARNPAQFEAALTRFAGQVGARLGVEFRTKMAVSTDPAADLDRVLDAEFHRLGVDLVVMASHVPGFRDYIFSSRAGFLASHSDLSVFVVR